jgi:ribosomal protein S18 acetylase RimI-like enzyme
MGLWRIRATVDDRPGYLAVLTASLALKSVNILAVQVHTTEAGAVDDFLVDAPDALSEEDLLAAVEKGRGRDAWVTRTEARELADWPTRALALASRLVRDPDALGDALSAMLGADAVIWRPAPGQDRYGANRGDMRLVDPTGGTYEISRPAPAFTPAEYARAQALVDLAATVVRQAADQVTLVLADGAEIRVRPAVRDDLTAVTAMHDRCTPLSRYRRYLAGSTVPPAARLERLLDPARGVTLVALAEEGRVVATATLVAEGAIGEVAVLVEDAWQRRGIGTALLRRLVAHGEQAGHAAVVAHAHADNTAALATLRRLGRRTQVPERDDTVLSVTVPLVPAPVDQHRTPAASA